MSVAWLLARLKMESHSLGVRLVDFLWKGLQEAGSDHSLYVSHSFRIGAATTAAKKGVEDCIIKTLGRWENSAYLQYVRLARDQLVGALNILASP